MLDVAVLDLSQLSVEVGPAGIGLGPSQLAVEEGGVGLVFEVVEPVGEGGRA